MPVYLYLGHFAEPIRDDLLVGLPDVVGHHCASQAEWLWPAFSRIAGRLMLHLRVQLAAEQDDYGRDPQPNHEADAGAERAMRPTVAVECCDIPGKEHRGSNPN